MKTQVEKWGNSLAVRIPGRYARELELQEGVELDVTRAKGGLLLRKRKREYTLAALLAQVRPENIHGEMDWGVPVVREACEGTSARRGGAEKLSGETVKSR